MKRLSLANVILSFHFQNKSGNAKFFGLVALQFMLCFVLLSQDCFHAEAYLCQVTLKTLKSSQFDTLHSCGYSPFPLPDCKSKVRPETSLFSSLNSMDTIHRYGTPRYNSPFTFRHKESNSYPFRIKGISSTITRMGKATNKDDSNTEEPRSTQSSSSSSPKKKKSKDVLKKAHEDTTIYTEDKDFVKKSQERSETAIKMIEAGALSEKQQEIFLGIKPKVTTEKKFEPIVGVTPSHMFAPRDADGELTEASFVYVDEYTCIGCTNCAAVAPDAFYMEDEHGRARVFQQWRTSKSLIKEAIETCPVDCIHYVSFEELERLETEREDFVLNPTARLVGNEGINSSTSGKGGPQTISGDRGMRCNNCPSKGCYDCPMFSVGDNPEYKAKKAKIDAKKMAKREEEKKAEGSKKRRRL